MEGHHTGSAVASTWGCVDVPAGPEVGWDIPGAPWTFMEREWEMGRREVELWMCHLCPSKLCHGWDEMDLDVTPAGHRGTKSHQRAVVEDTGSLWNGHPCPGMLCLDTLRPWTALPMWDEALWSRTRQDELELIPPRPVWGQKAAFGLVLGLMQL